MTLIEQLADEQTWNEFFSYKQQLGHLSQQHEKELQQFIGEKAYLEVLDRIRTKGFPLPQKRLISKVNSDKKRVVYTYPTAENYLLKLLTYLLIRRYDRAFAPNLYSFRVRHGVKRAIQFLRGAENLSARYVYKADIHDYFNSVDVELLLPRLQRIMADETECFRLIADLLTNPHVALPDGQIVCERKGIMAGVPLASFLANLYLNDLDWHFHRQGMLYARYSDDIILFASSAEEREMAIDYLHDYLQAHRLTINEKKEVVTEPSQKWTFLGVSFENGVFDVSEVSASKLKMKMRRKSRALLRWKARKGVDNDKAARAFVKAFNRKLYDNDAENELTWSRWFFPIINTTRTLTLIDHYMQDCLRYIATEKRTKGRYRFTYEEMKALGYRNLVHEYYQIQEQKINEDNQIKNQQPVRSAK